MFDHEPSLKLRLLIGSVAAGLLVGCSSGSFDATVSGTITLDGRPVSPGVVIYSPQTTGGGSSRGRIEEGGSYTMVTRHEEGIASGVYRVSVRVFEKGEAPAPGERQMAKLAPLVPEKYLTPKTSGLEFEVEPGSNTIDIELTSAENGG